MMDILEKVDIKESLENINIKVWILYHHLHPLPLHGILR